MFESDSTVFQANNSEGEGDLRDVIFIEACKVYVRGLTTGRTCDCKGKCITEQCPCKKNGNLLFNKM